MKVGKIPESVLKRSVFKQIHTKRSEVLLGAGVGEDCAAVKLADDEMFVMSTDPITGTATDIGNLAIHITLNDLASAGAEPVGVLLTILLPENSEEAVLKETMAQIEIACAEANVQIMGGHTEVTKAVNQPLINVCGVGKAKVGKLVSTAGAKVGDDIIVTKWIGLEGTSIIAKEKEQELLNRYPAQLVEEAKNFDKYLSVLPEAASAVKSGVSAMHDVTEGGIFGALWEMAEASGVGLEIDLKKIPVKQETIEVCEFFGINPYELISSGSMLMAAPDGNTLVRELEKQGIHAAVVGKAVAGNDRVLMNDDETRFLEPPKTDELYKVV
ncbi:AIR synthase family protein [Roseburia sp. MSJ-14]|uniref:AIR synthase family protein n=1 Tax=Roseburia sp. MSJ-14 TaxID=2841514 RepID=UPI001C102D93|nr:AIR synthase family protein [Roseburia sp. MSJ-14]MBU5475080.1 AIR synthase family protein [Roseburia sp. MSJ-14]